MMEEGCHLAEPAADREVRSQQEQFVCQHGEQPQHVSYARHASMLCGRSIKLRARLLPARHLLSCTRLLRLPDIACKWLAVAAAQTPAVMPACRSLQGQKNRRRSTPMNVTTQSLA